ncbi:MAG: ABC transporter permease [Ktedonobacteraceae bacterium]|nr:ABC transporter permease [Ktedonobacteraceae bacterium]
MSLQQTTTDEAAARRTIVAGRRYRRQQSALDILILFLVVIVISVIYGLITPNTFAFNSFANIQNALYTIPIEVGIPALGVGVLMIAGEFDLSVGVNFVFSSIVMAQLATNGMNVWLAALIGILIGTSIGLLNGLITLWLGIPSFITTLGTSFFWSAAVLFVHGASSQPFSPDPVFASLTSGSIGPIPATFVWWMVLALAFWGLLERNRIGNHIFAVGGNKQAATATGVKCSGQRCWPLL